MAILVEVDIYSRNRDADGPSYDVSINWVDATLPSGAVDPAGDLFYVEALNGWTNEQIRDAIRQEVITILETPTIDGGYNFPIGQLSFDEVRVEGYTNQGADTVPNAPVVVNWFSGDPFYPEFPNVNGNTRLIQKVKGTVKFADSTTWNQMVFRLNFKVSPTISTKLEYWVIGTNASTGASVWTSVVSSTLVGTELVLTVDLDAVGQDILWTTGNVTFTLALKRITASSINWQVPGKLQKATITLTKEP